MPGAAPRPLPVARNGGFSARVTFQCGRLDLELRDARAEIGAAERPHDTLHEGSETHQISAVYATAFGVVFQASSIRPIQLPQRHRS